jgi:hypothetical protein
MNNSAAIGYAIMAMEALIIDVKIIEKVAREMYYQMDIKDEETAERVYQNY